MYRSAECTVCEAGPQPEASLMIQPSETRLKLRQALRQLATKHVEDLPKSTRSPLCRWAGEKEAECDSND